MTATSILLIVIGFVIVTISSILSYKNFGNQGWNYTTWTMLGTTFMWMSVVVLEMEF